LRALVVGATGQLGRALVALLPGALPVAGRAELDLRAPEPLAELMARASPEVVFNAAAFNNVDGAESQPADAFAVNALGPLHLARACRAAGALLVHVSTDYVFDGSDERPIPEERCPRPLGVYGASKLAGEALVSASGAWHLIVRTSALFGAGGSRDKGGSFVDRVLSRARAREPLRVVDDQTFAPTYAPDLAQAVVALARAGARGLVHVTNEGSCTWHELARAALAAAGLDAPVEAITSESLAAPARRPRYSVLDTGRYRALGLPRLRPWREALAAALRD
jgi:dTDP-4-dehydrorhamnose reductase